MKHWTELWIEICYTLYLHMLPVPLVIAFLRVTIRLVSVVLVVAWKT